jgi:hypothetical protein
MSSVQSEAQSITGLVVGLNQWQFMRPADQLMAINRAINRMINQSID